MRGLRGAGGSPALALYLLLSAVAEPALRLWLSRRALRGREDPSRMRERFGVASRPRPAGRLVWLHGASVGEALSILPLVDALRAQAPDLEVLVTSGTVTAAERMAALLPACVAHQYVPVDSRGAVRRFLRHWRPDLAIWIESEFWPRLMIETAGRGTPMMLLNARVSARSAAGWGWAPGMARRLLRLFERIVAQDGETVARLAALGVDPAHLRAGGNLKSAVALPGCAERELAMARLALGDRPVWLAASTHPGEEAIAAEAHRALTVRVPHSGLARALLILAPRHPERGPALAERLEQGGLIVAQRSAGQVPGPATDVWLADTLGEMGLWYRLALVSFVGGSLVARGGHTPFEPAGLGSAILHGPRVENFAPAYAALKQAGGAEAVLDAASLEAAVARLLGDPQLRAKRVAAAAQVRAAMTPDLAGLAREALALAGTEAKSSMDAGPVPPGGRPARGPARRTARLMRAPAFWDRPAELPGWQARALAPLSLLWRLAGHLRRAVARPVRARVPVICVGNLTAGGAGKTPLVAALVARLEASGHAPVVLSRGHGGRLKGPHRVDPAQDAATDVGDEPLLLAALARVWIARDRGQGALAAAADGAGAIVMDDGFQNPGLARDLSILVVDAEAGFGNCRVIPAGPLREPVAEGLARADVVVLVGRAEVRERALRRWPALAAAKPVAAEVVAVQTGLDLRGVPVVAFAGIGRPEKFFATLAQQGAKVVEAVPFADHQTYAPAVLRRLLRDARARNAMLVTTEKDAVRLPDAFRREVMVVPVRTVLEDWSAIDAHLAELGLTIRQ